MPKEKKELTELEKAQKEIKSLKRENKKLNKDLLELVKNSGPIKFTEADAGIDYALDNQKILRLGLKGLVGNSTPIEAHSAILVEVMKSLGSIVENFIVPDEDQDNENEAD